MLVVLAEPPDTLPLVHHLRRVKRLNLQNIGSDGFWTRMKPRALYTGSKSMDLRGARGPKADRRSAFPNPKQDTSCNRAFCVTARSSPDFPLGVKTGNGPIEQKISGYLQKSDICA